MSRKFIFGGSFTSFQGLFDLYGGANLGLSLRKLSVNQTLCVRVRRDSDNSEQDFGFVNNQLDTASLLTFCGASSGFVSIWYGATAINATQTVASQQPRIVTNGVLEVKNGKPALFFEQARGCDMLLTNSITETANTKIIVGANVGSGINGLIAFYDSTTTGNSSTIGCFPSYNFYLFNSNNNLYIKYPPPPINTDQQVLIGGDDLTNVYFRRNANSILPAPIPQAITHKIDLIGRYNTLYGNSLTQEIIHYPNSQFSNINGIETNINDFYGIY
jgi:hypothetical protein